MPIISVRDNENKRRKRKRKKTKTKKKKKRDASYNESMRAKCFFVHLKSTFTQLTHHLGGLFRSSF